MQKENWNKLFEKQFLLYLFLVALGLHCCVQAFSSCGKWGLVSSCGACCRGQALGCTGLVALQQVGSSQIRDQTCVSTSRQDSWPLSHQGRSWNKLLMQSLSIVHFLFLQSSRQLASWTSTRVQRKWGLITFLPTQAGRGDSISGNICSWVLLLSLMAARKAALPFVFCHSDGTDFHPDTRTTRQDNLGRPCTPSQLPERPRDYFEDHSATHSETSFPQQFSFFHWGIIYILQNTHILT